MVERWLWLYVASMAAGLLLFASWAVRPQGVPRIEYAVAAAIPLWSGGWYLVIVLGGGQVEVAGRSISWARYVDWAVTSPLLLVALALTAMYGLSRKRWALIRTMVAANLLIFACGLLAELVSNDRLRYGLYVIGLLAFLMVYSLIWGPLRSLASRKSDQVAAAFTQVALLLSVLWIGYPVIWILGPFGVDWLASDTASVLFAMLSIVTKVGWSILDLGLLRNLSRRGELVH